MTARKRRIRMLLAVLFFTFFSAFKAMAETPSPRLLAALIAQESGNRYHPNGDDYAIGDKKLPEGQWAYGCLQIRQPCVDDVNKWLGTHYKSSDMLGNRELSIMICQRYIDRWTVGWKRQPTEQEMARVWNGGPRGFKKKSTSGYWSDVKKRLSAR